MWGDYQMKTIKSKIKNGRAEFFCEYCKKFHYHGVESGTRSSHCTNPKSPLFSKEYYLEVAK